jgi:hypothetical protein
MLARLSYVTRHWQQRHSTEIDCDVKGIIQLLHHYNLMVASDNSEAADLL